MLDSIMGLLDKPRNMAFTALGSKDGSGSGLLQALLGVDPNSTAGQVGGTVADIALDPLNLVGAGAFNAARKAGRLGVAGARAAEGERALDALKGVASVGPADDAFRAGAGGSAGGRNRLLDALGEAPPPAAADLQLSGVPSLPDGMGGFGPPSQGGLALPEFTGLTTGGQMGLPASPFPMGAAAGEAALDMPATTVGEFLARKKPVNIGGQDEFFSMGRPAPLEPPPTAGAITSDVRLSGQMAMPDSYGTALPPQPPQPTASVGATAADLPPPGSMVPDAVAGGPARYSEYRTAGDNPLRIGVDAPPGGPAPLDRGLLRGDEVMAPRMQGGVQAGMPDDLAAMMQDIDPLLLSELMASALGGATAGRAGTQPFLTR